MARLPSISKYCVPCRVGRVGIGLVPGVGQADAVHRPLLDAVQRIWYRNAGGLQDGRHDVDEVVELAADAARVPMWPGHEIAMPCAVPPKCEATCLTHLNGVLIAQAQAAAKCGKVLSEPQNGYHRSCAATGIPRHR
jgi:hypothetical protein